MLACNIAAWVTRNDPADCNRAVLVAAGIFIYMILLSLSLGLFYLLNRCTPRLLSVLIGRK